MDDKEMAKRLGTLLQIDVDAEHAYGQAIKEIETADIRRQLTEFRDDHKRHVSELTALLRELGRKAPERSRDIKGFAIEGFTAIRSRAGTEGALKAMKTNEKLTNKKYNKALSWELSPSAKNLVERNHNDEKRHLDYIERALTERLWEKRAAV